MVDTGNGGFGKGGCGRSGIGMACETKICRGQALTTVAEAGILIGGVFGFWKVWVCNGFRVPS